MKKQSLILISFIFLLNTFSHSTEINAAIGKAKVIDGDTIVINGEKIRFGGIDTVTYTHLTLPTTPRV